MRGSMKFSPVWFALAGLVASCSGRASGPEAWSPVTIEDLNDAQRAQQATATAARDAMMAELMQTLSGEIKSDGPAAAIGVCKEKAPDIAAAVGKRFGVRIGRFSHRLRSPQNVAPAWAQGLLADDPQEERLAAGPSGNLGVTLPIRIAQKCLLCHGPADSLESDVRGALASRYPQDQATGYAEGDLRGWFWIEVSAPQ